VVSPDSDEISRASPYSGTLQESINFRLQDYHLLRYDVPDICANLLICGLFHIEVSNALQPHVQVHGLACSDFARRY
jgi:hypothetical protein